MDLSNKRILVIKQSSLGDIVHTLPVVHALKRHHPDCCIGWVVEQGLAEIVERDAAVDNVYPIHIPATSDPQAANGVYLRAFLATMQTLAGLRRAFRETPYDISLDLHASFRSGLLSLMNKGACRVGFKDAREMNTLFQHEHIRVPQRIDHALEKNLLFADHLHCPVAESDFFMTTSDADKRLATTFLLDHGITGKQRFAYINPTARWATKFWSAERWALLADQLLDAELKIVIGGSRSDRDYIRSITQLMTHPAPVAAGRLTLTQSVALIERAAVYTGLDTGPMHIAAMVKTPVVALFGPTHPERVGPYNVLHRIIQAPNLDCLCCRQRTCSHMSCMRGITVEQVYQAVVDLLQEQEQEQI